MTSDSRMAILDAALRILRYGGSVSLESAAKEVGLSKPGVMHHFPTKEALMLSLVDHAAAGWHDELVRRLQVPFDEATPVLRLRTYLQWCLTGEFDQADLVMLSDPRLRQRLLVRWAEHMAPWVEVSDDLPMEKQASHTAARLLAEGAWFASATDTFSPSPELRSRIGAITEQLLED